MRADILPPKTSGCLDETSSIKHKTIVGDHNFGQSQGSIAKIIIT